MQYFVEDIVEDKQDLERLGQEAWDEVDQAKGHMQYCLDWDQYSAANRAGMVRYYTVRDDEGEKVGFAIFLITRSLHCKGYYVATSDCIYLRKQYRRGTGEELLKLIIDDLKDQGVDWVTVNFKSWLDSGNLASRLGCSLYEHVYQRSLN